MNIEKIRPTVALGVALCVAPLFLVVLSFFLLNRPLFNELNIWQFVGVSGGISIPVLLFNGYCSQLIQGEHENNEAEIAENFGMGGIFSCLILTICLLVSYWQKLPLRTYYWIVFFTEIAFFIVAYITNRVENKKSKIQIDQNQ